MEAHMLLKCDVLLVYGILTFQQRLDYGEFLILDIRLVRNIRE